jgi:predicted phage tail protein
MKILLRIISLIGVILFGTVFYFTYQTPEYVEEIGKEFIKSKVQQKTNNFIEGATNIVENSDSTLAKYAEKLLEKNQAQIENIKSQLKNNANEKIADIIAEMRDLSCECRNKYAAYIKNKFQLNLVSLEAASTSLQDFMKTKYMEVANELKKDIRIFSGSNAIIFALLLIVSFMRKEATTHLYLPAILLVISTVICSYFYIFQQNWLMTIIYNDYIGFGYLVYLGILFLILCDISFNRARVSTEVINGAANAVGSAFSVVSLPC